MSREYAENKIKEALHLTRGNTTQARQHIIALAMNDPKLLKELAKPHMAGIVAHAVGRVVRGKTEDAPIPAPSEDADKDTLGMDILKAIAGGDTAQFGQENYGRPVPKQGASQRHIDAINQMVKGASSKDRRS